MLTPISPRKDIPAISLIDQPDLRVGLSGRLHKCHGFAPKRSLVVTLTSEQARHADLQRAQAFGAFQTELRFPLWRELHGAVFADTGAVFRWANHIAADELRYGVGAGLRYHTPAGALVLDVGFNPEAKTEVGEYYKEFDEHPELRLFLDRLEATVRALQERTTIILDSGVAPFGLFDFDEKSRADAGDGNEASLARVP